VQQETVGVANTALVVTRSW